MAPPGSPAGMRLAVLTVLREYSNGWPSTGMIENMPSQTTPSGGVRENRPLMPLTSRNLDIRI